MSDRMPQNCQQVGRRESWTKCQIKDKMSECTSEGRWDRMSKYSSTKHDKVSDNMFGNMSTAMSEYVSNKCRIECQNMPDKVSKFMSDNIPAKLCDSMSEYMPKECHITCQIEGQKKAKGILEKMSDTMPDKTSNEGICQIECHVKIWSIFSCIAGRHVMAGIARSLLHGKGSVEAAWNQWHSVANPIHVSVLRNKTHVWSLMFLLKIDAIYMKTQRWLMLWYTQ